jgi:hypothetical protein
MTLTCFLISKKQRWYEVSDVLNVKIKAKRIVIFRLKFNIMSDYL